MAIPGLDSAGLISSLVGPIIGSLAGQNENQWTKGLLMQILQAGGRQQEEGRGNYAQIINSILPLLQQGAMSSGAQLNGPDGFLAKTGDQLTQQNAAIPGLFSNLGGWKGQNSELAQQMQGIMGGTGNTQNLANQVFAGGGWSPQSQQGFDQISKLLGGDLDGSGQGRHTMGELLNNGGNTDFTTQLQNTARQSLSDGGVTGILQTAGKPLQGILNAGGDTANNDILRQFGLDSLQTGGYTANSQRGSNAALQGVLSGGATPTTQGVQDRGLELFNREALLPLEQVLSFARDEAGGNAIDAFRKMSTQAQNRGGGAGSLTRSGMQNDGMADFADDIARNESDAVMKALLGQQGLRQNEQLAGGTAATQGANAETARMGASGDILSALEGGATNRYKAGGDLAQGANTNETQRLLTALGQIPGLQNSATNVMGTLGNLGVQGGSLANERTGMGTDLIKMLTGNDINKNQVGLNSLINLLGNQNDFTIGAGNLSNNIAGTQGNLMSTLLSNSLETGKLDLNQLVSMISAMQGGSKNNIDFGSLLSGNFFNNTQGAQNAANPWMQYAQGGSNLIGGLSGTQMPNPFSNLGGK